MSTDANGNPLISEPIPDNPPVNYTRNGVISNVKESVIVRMCRAAAEGQHEDDADRFDAVMA